MAEAMRRAPAPEPRLSPSDALVLEAAAVAPDMEDTSGGRPTELPVSRARSAPQGHAQNAQQPPSNAPLPPPSSASAPSAASANGDRDEIAAEPMRVVPPDLKQLWNDASPHGGGEWRARGGLSAWSPPRPRNNRPKQG